MPMWSTSAAGKDALVHKRYALTGGQAIKACMRRELTLMKRNGFVFAFRFLQVCPQALVLSPAGRALHEHAHVLHTCHHICTSEQGMEGLIHVQAIHI